MVGLKRLVVVFLGVLLVSGVRGATTGSAGGGQQLDNRQPWLGLNHIIRLMGTEDEIGEVALFGGNFAPRGWAFTNGQLLSADGYSDLFGLLGTTYGGDGSTFALPDLRGRVTLGSATVAGTGPGLTERPIGVSGGEQRFPLGLNELPVHAHGLPSGRETASVGGGQAHTNMQPYQSMHYMIATMGVFPSSSLTHDDEQAGQFGFFNEPYLGEVAMYAPGSTASIEGNGWIEADGRELQINQYSALYSILGTEYGGNERTTFRVPDLRSRVPVHAGAGSGPGLSPVKQGQQFGEESFQLSSVQMVEHKHLLPPSSGIHTDPAGVGSSQTQANAQPSLGINYIVALQGVFPSSNLTYDDGVTEPLGNADPFLGSISMFAGNFAPRGWAFADGQLLPIANNTALFSIFGTIYGGDGRSTFALPDLRGRTPVHAGRGPGLDDIRLGARSGSEDLSLTLSNLPTHTHGVPDYIPGDFNLDGQVDVRDLSIWAVHFGEQGGAPYEHGDADLNHQVDVQDLSQWAIHFGDVETPPAQFEILNALSSAVAVPEPSGLALMALGVACIGFRRKQTRH